MDTPVLDETAIHRLTRVGGDALVRQMIELYLEQGPARIAALTQGAAAADADRVLRAAHTLKSTAGNLGASSLQATAGAVEALAGGGRIDDELIARLQREYEACIVALSLKMEELSQ